MIRNDQSERVPAIAAGLYLNYESLAMGEAITRLNGHTFYHRKTDLNKREQLLKEARTEVQEVLTEFCYMTLLNGPDTHLNLLRVALLKDHQEGIVVPLAAREYLTTADLIRDQVTTELVNRIMSSPDIHRFIQSRVVAAH